MSKKNVNPDRYKVAGRKRQGETTAQTGNKQNAGSQKAAVARSAAPSNPALPNALGRAVKTATRKTRATPRQTLPGHSRGHTLVPGSSAPHARFARTKPAPVLRPTGVDPPVTAKKATKKATT